MIEIILLVYFSVAFIIFNIYWMEKGFIEAFAIGFLWPWFSAIVLFVLAVRLTRKLLGEGL